MSTPRTSIPTHASDLEGLVAEARRQTEEVTGILAGLSAEAASWRPGADRWSVAGHVAHMVLVNGPYFESMRRAVEEARSSGRLGEGPYRHPWIASRFANMMEPPPKMRVRTFRTMVPDPDVADPLDDFRRLQDELVAILQSARGVELGGARFPSPFMKLLRLSLGTAFHALLAHNRRHIWLIRELMDTEGFPGADSSARA